MAKNDFYSPCQVNSGSTVAAKAGQDIYLVGATANFTANSVNVVIGTNNAINLSSSPMKITGSITNATTGTLWYYHYGL